MYIDSKQCTLIITCENKILKKVTVKSLKFLTFETNAKVAIPDKYANTKYTKTVIIDYYNKNKEYDKKNNKYKFKF